MNTYLNPKVFNLILKQIKDVLENLPPILTGLSIPVLDYHTVFDDQHSQVNDAPIVSDTLTNTSIPSIFYTFVDPINLVTGTNSIMTDLTISGDTTTINYLLVGIIPGLYNLIFYTGSNASGNVTISIDDVTSGVNVLFNYVNNVISNNISTANIELTNNYSDNVLLPSESKKSLVNNSLSVIHITDEIKTIRIKFRPSSGMNFILAHKIYLVQMFPNNVVLPLPDSTL